MTRSLTNRIQGAFLSLFICAGLGVASASLAATPDKTEGGAPPHWAGKHHGRGGKPHCGIMKQLNLTDAQKAQLKAQHEAFRTENAAALASIRSKREQLHQLGKDPANEAKRKALLDELRQERRALMEKHKDMMKGILTPDQVAQMEKAKAACKAEWAKKRKSISQPDQVAPATGR